MRGNSATGKVRMVSVPTSTRTIEITMATMGRLIKNFDIELPARSSRAKWLGIHLHARPNFLHTLNDHPFARLQSVRNNPLAADRVADLNCSDTYFVVIIHRRDLVAALQLGDCALGNKQGVPLDSDDGANLAVSAGTQNISGIGK